MAEEMFSQFTNGDVMKVGDQVVGLRSGDNYRFAFPGAGVRDGSGNNLFYWSSAGASAVNYLLVTNSITGTNPTISSAGSDASPGLTLLTQGSGNIVLNPGGTGDINHLAPSRYVSGSGIQTDTSAGNTVLFQAYNTGSSTYTTLGTLTAGATPSLAFGLISATNLNLGFTTTATAAGTTTLTVDDTQIQEFTGSTTQTVVMPVTSTLSLGQQFYIINNSSGIVTVQSSGANTIQALAAGTSVLLTVILTSGTTAASWQSAYITDAGLAPPGAAGTILRSDGSAWTATTATYPNVATGTGTQLRANGTNWAASTATYADTYAVSTILYASASNTVTGLASVNRAVLTSNATGVPVMTPLATDGQVIIGSTSGAPAAATLTPGTGISIANGSNTITISASGGGFGIATIAGTTQAAAVNTMYIALNSGQTTLSLPATFSVGDTVVLVGSTANTGGWVVAANTGDTIRVNNVTSSAGGTVTCTAIAGQVIELVADVANTSWIMVDTTSVLLTTT